MKPWGSKEFWGVGSEYDPDWLLTEGQKKIRGDLMELCRTKIRPHAIECDKTYTFPRESLDAMGDLGLLGLVIPKDMGGMGETHTCAAMVVETLARYGCPATAMIYTMHVSACTTLLFRHHTNPHLKKLLQRISKEKLLGALSASDPATGEGMGMMGGR
ncbi:probable acyl-CoA dehydrogenase YngJ [Penaeus japonicus]|uniref:probable acyl-CoA dehydrogenase YngJ n=1 Tax=Penaeus japonicus TaxID=27405 RepID=UPI001C713976|nr:probable acyl-CoA dehydrogenase YngJ [Penaeus japonicus]